MLHKKTDCEVGWVGQSEVEGQVWTVVSDGFMKLRKHMFSVDGQKNTNMASCHFQQSLKWKRNERDRPIGSLVWPQFVPRREVQLWLTVIEQLQKLLPPPGRCWWASSVVNKSFRIFISAVTRWNKCSESSQGSSPPTRTHQLFFLTSECLEPGGESQYFNSWCV